MARGIHCTISGGLGPVFEHALENTDGQDLNRVLWLNSANSELWLTGVGAQERGWGRGATAYLLLNVGNALHALQPGGFTPRGFVNKGRVKGWCLRALSFA